MFVEKALLAPTSPYIFNSEQMTFNQIKKEEYLLKDISESTWIVGYVDREKTEDAEIVIDAGDTIDSDNIIDLPGEYSDFVTNYLGEAATQQRSIAMMSTSPTYIATIPTEFTYVANTSRKKYRREIGEYFLTVDSTSEENIWDFKSAIKTLDFDRPSTIQIFIGSVSEENAPNTNIKDLKFMNQISNKIINYLKANISFKNDIKLAYDSLINDHFRNNTDGYTRYVTAGGSTAKEFFINNQDKIFRYTDENNVPHYYNIKVRETSLLGLGEPVLYNTDISYDNLNNIRTNLVLGAQLFMEGQYTNEYGEDAQYLHNYQYSTNIDAFGLRNNSTSGLTLDGVNIHGANIRLSFNNRVLSLQVEEVPNILKIQLSAANERPKNESGLYDVFAIPYNDTFRFKNPDPTIGIINNNSKAAMLMAQGIATKLTTANLYDLQILPFCPCPEYIKTDENGAYIQMDEIGSNAGNTISNEDRDGNVQIISMLIWCKKSAFQSPINTPVPLNNITDPLQRKIDNQTKVYRLCSPGYMSIYEFQPQMNNGITKFVIQTVFQPYNPFIRIAPVFNSDSLYGINSDYDCKGLILKGDFSIPRSESQWQKYQIENKNFDAIFQREIKNLKNIQEVEATRQGWQIAANTIQAAVSGAAAGSMIGGGNPIGVGVGAAIGGVTSLAAGLKDFELSEDLRKEALSYKTDMYNFQLGNIRALPNTLTKSSPLSDNNPIFPIIEVYDCSPEEKEAFKNKIRYNGMTVGVIGTLAEYKDNKQYYNDFDYMYFKGTIIRLDSLYEDSHVINVISNELNRGIFI